MYAKEFVLVLKYVHKFLWYTSVQRVESNFPSLYSDLYLANWLFINRTWKKWQCMAPKIRVEKEVWLFPFSLITLSGETSCHVVRTQKQSMERSVWWWTEASRSQSDESVGPPAPVKASDGRNLGWSCNCNPIEDLKPEPPSLSTPSYLNHRNCGLTKVC